MIKPVKRYVLSVMNTGSISYFSIISFKFLKEAMKNSVYVQTLHFLTFYSTK